LKQSNKLTFKWAFTRIHSQGCWRPYQDSTGFDLQHDPCSQS